MPRFTFGQADLLSGLDLVAVVMGLFGVADILESLDKTVRPVIHARVTSLVPDPSGHQGRRPGPSCGGR